MKKVIFAFLLAVFTAAFLCVPSSAAWLSSEAPVMKYGSTGWSVTQLQQDLNTLGYGLSTDGSFGPATLNAVKDYQSQMGLEVDGSVGPATKNSIISTINSYESSTSIQIPGSGAMTKGSKGIRVRFLQKMLCLLGYPIDIDGSFGNATYEAVRSFQSDYGIAIDGSCGPETIQYINGAILGTYSPKPVQTEPPIVTTVPETTTTPPTTTTPATTTTARTTTTTPAITTTARTTTTARATTTVPKAETTTKAKTVSTEKEVVPEKTTVTPAEESEPIFDDSEPESEPDATTTEREILPEIITDPRIDSGAALQYGSKGDRVKQLQRCLVYLGWEIEVDGSFGNATRNAVKEFQKKYGLTVDGSCGPATRAKINEVCESTIYAMSIDTDKESKTCAVGGTISLSVKYSPINANTGKTVQWSSSNKAIATVDKDGKVTGVSAGNANITATFRARDGYTFKKVFKLTVKVIQPKSIQIEREPIGKLSDEIIPVGYSVKLNAVVKPDNAITTVKWKSSAPEYLKVDSDGTVTGIKATLGNASAGVFISTETVTITATADNGVKTTKKFRVVEYKPKSFELKLNDKVIKNKGTYTFNTGDQIKIEKSFEPVYALSDLQFKVGDKKIVEIDGDQLKAISPGETTVTCKTKNSKVSVQFTVKVEDAKWQWPLPLDKSNWISGEFWQERSNHMHRGIDIAVGNGTDVLATRDGTIAYVHSKKTGARGLYVVVDHGDGYYSIYQHLSESLKNVGDFVNKGDVIAKSGDSGSAGSYHLHFEVKRGCKIGLRDTVVVTEVVNKIDNLANPSPLIQWSGIGPSFKKGDYLDDIFIDRIEYDKLPKNLYNDYSKYRNYMNEPRG
ncbi:MAG: peptidoglycan-binding protein [Bacteroides sp.]|nr:peptidoglycan-binding protein [Eubacterium sp.]MCM1418369.1 peptidoglycan-binding protein [Roseburia sp.]MCM1462470.1 peptidoglycan-binding protein [Bacteroides sp.]